METNEDPFLELAGPVPEGCQRLLMMADVPAAAAEQYRKHLDEGLGIAMRKALANEGDDDV